MVPRPVPETQEAYLHDMLESAERIKTYMTGVTFEEFWNNQEKRDAVALRLSVLGESAHRVDHLVESSLPKIKFKSIRGMRNRIAHDYGAVDFKIIWEVTQTEIDPLLAALKSYFRKRSKIRES